VAETPEQVGVFFTVFKPWNEVAGAQFGVPYVGNTYVTIVDNDA